MRLLPDNLVIQYISDFCICQFKDTTHSENARPHWYVNVPIDDGSSLLLCIFTSQIEKQKKYYTRVNIKALKSLVNVDNETFSFLPQKKGIVNCNNAELLTKVELQKRIHPKYGLEVAERNIPDDLKIQIVRAIKDSPLINEHTKKMLRP